MDKDIRRHNRIIWCVLGVLVLLSIISIALALKAPKPITIEKNYVGQAGKNGIDASVDYARITDYINQSFFTLPKPQDGKDGKDGKDGANPTVDYAKIYAYVDSSIAALPKPVDGKNGVDGQNGADARTSEFDCQNGDFVTRYVGDDTWRVLQENSVACKGTRQ